MRSFLFLSALLFAFLANAATYYVSPNGNDSNSGTSQSQAWRTLNRLAQVQYAFQSGDQILLERGGVYRGTIPVGSSGTPGAPLVYGAYGTGDDPVISGSDVITGWQQYQGNIWRAPVSDSVQYVHVNGKMMTLARYPNTGWLRMDQGTATTLRDNDLGQANGYWVGATAVIRATNWSYDRAVVSGFTNKTLSFPSIYEDPGSYGWGYFMENKLSELDAPGEWYYDRSAGMLYLQAPGNVNPNTLVVEAAVRPHGMVIAWQRQYVQIRNLTFRHQKEACIRNDGGNYIDVSNCTFRDSYHGIRSYGQFNLYNQCLFRGLYATGAFLIDSGTVFSNNHMVDIANHPGRGENLWGYFGLRVTGGNNQVKNNLLDSIGYIGIVMDKNTLVEKNIVQRCLTTLNDGGGIAFDNANGMNIRNNIVRDMVGNLESAATDHPTYEPISHGIYFGNTTIRNTTVEGNTVSKCTASGIHVDHTMVASGNVVKDNVLFDNGIQLSISDYSNYNGPNAQQPFFKENFNDVYSGNVMYSLTKDQLCMRLYNCYSATPVNFGTFTNNRYFNPYNEMSIRVQNTFAGTVTFYTLERWKAVRSVDANSTRSPLRLPDHVSTQDLSGNLVMNGDFTSNVNGWSGWPANAQVSRVTDKLDNGALKANLPNNSQYPSFTLSNPDVFPVQNQAWYRLRVSIQSDALGELFVGVRGQSQSSLPYGMWRYRVPFDQERRDLEMYFQANLTDQSQVQFQNQWTEPMYYLDNVELTKVNVQPLDPHERHKLYVNDLSTAQSFNLPAGCWRDIDGNALQGSIQVPAFSSRVAYRIDGADCGVVVPTGGVRVKMLLGGAMDGSESLMRDDLRTLGLVPTTEPYSGMGYTLENAGVSVANGVMQASGANAVVDWVLVQLHEDNSGYTVAGRRAALVLRNGKVVTPQGDELITFNGSAIGRKVSVKHRNHLGVLCTTSITSEGQTVDLSQYGTPTFGTNAQTMIDGRMALWPGSVMNSGEVKYTGIGNDRDGILLLIGIQPNNVVPGYLVEDTNMNGFVSYTGLDNDREMVLLTVGGLFGTAIRPEAMP